MNKRNWLVSLALLAVIAVPVTLKLARGDAAKSVQVETVATHVLTPSILASGALTYETQVTMAPEVTAQVKEILVIEGASVQRGQLLMRLDPTAPRAEIEQYDALIRQARLTIETRQLQYEAQRTKWQRYDGLKTQGMIDANTLDDFKSQLDLAEVALRTSREALSQNLAQLDAAKERLAKTEIRAPLAGTITAIYVKVGETAVQGFSSIAGSQLLQVADTTHLEAEINVDETDIARIKLGAAANIVPAAFPDQTLAGHIVLVSVAPRQQAGQNNKTYPVRIRLDNTTNAFRTGMSCRAEIMTTLGDQSATLAVPVQAVKYEEQLAGVDTQPKTQATTLAKTLTSVFVVNQDRVAKRTVETGAADDAYIAITKGLTAGETIVIGPAKTLLFLKDKDRISIETTTDQPATDQKRATAQSSAVRTQ